jgi:hypothetical protein
VVSAHGRVVKPDHGRDRFELVRYLAWGVGGLALLIFLLLLRRRN